MEDDDARGRDVIISGKENEAAAEACSEVHTLVSTIYNLKVRPGLHRSRELVVEGKSNNLAELRRRRWTSKRTAPAASSVAF